MQYLPFNYSPITLANYLNLLSNPDSPKSVSFDIPSLINPTFDLFPELSLQGSFNLSSRHNLFSLNDRLSFRFLHSHLFPSSFYYYHDRLPWLLATLFFDNSPFLILRNTFGTGDSFPNILILDFTKYKQAAFFLFSFMQSDSPDCDEFYHPSPERISPLSGTILQSMNFLPPPSYLVPSLNVPYIESALNLLLSNHSFL